MRRGQLVRRAEGDVDGAGPALDADEEGAGVTCANPEAEGGQGVVDDDERALTVPGLGEAAACRPFVEVYMLRMGCLPLLLHRRPPRFEVTGGGGSGRKMRPAQGARRQAGMA